MMPRRSFLSKLAALLGARAAQSQPTFPPAPKWQPPAWQPLDRLIERSHYYLNGKGDFVVFKHGTIAHVTKGASDEQAKDEAHKIIHDIYMFHPDVHPAWMDDGNILVRYNHPAYNIVLKDIADTHWDEIDRNHLDALVDAEVLITPLGQNVFDDFGKMVLWGRCYMFMDAQDPEIVRIERATA